MDVTTAAMFKIVFSILITTIQHIIAIHARIQTPTETTLVLYNNIRLANEAKALLDRIQ